MVERESMQFDVVIVGAGPAGLSAAIRLKQQKPELSVCIVDKVGQVGGHSLSGAVLEPTALQELFPDWQERQAPLTNPVTEDQFLLLTEHKAVRLPTPPQMHNKGNYIISLGVFCRWLASQAETLGVEIYPGFAARDILCDEQGKVAGIITGEFGRDKDGKEREGFQPAMELRATHTLFAEGCRGSLSQQLMEQFQLREGKEPQTYGLGIKEIWEIEPDKHNVGKVVHSIGWPLDSQTYGGSFIYHLEGNKVAVGFVVGLDYSNPTLSPYQEMQRFKTHPAIQPLLEGGKRISYGARALNEGGFQSIPELTFPGGALIGCSAGFVNVPKIKGIHNAMFSGIAAADAITQEGGLESYPIRLKDHTPVIKELHKVRNIRPAFQKGMWFGLGYAAVDTYILRGKAPWTWPHHADHTSLKPKGEWVKIEYPKPDGKITFDLMSSVFLSNTNHEENQPVHLTLKDTSVPVEINLNQYDSPESYYCPAGVYEIVQEGGQPRLQINAPNCVHCKTCDIKDPTQNIVWVTPEGGGGPNYTDM